MKKIILLIVALTFSLLTIGQSINNGEDCIYCGENLLGTKSSAIGDNNTNKGDFSLAVGENNQISRYLKTVSLLGNENMAIHRTGNYSIALGTNNEIITDYSYVFGKDNIVEGKYGVAIGYGNQVSGMLSVALGSWCKTYRSYSIAIGKGCEADSLSTALGFHAAALNGRNFAFGHFVKSSGERSMTLGAGIYNSTYLENSIENSLMVGFISDVPTLFISSSNGSGTTGKIGIGNVTEPEAKLHIKADIAEDASLLLQPITGANYGVVKLYDNNHTIKVRNGDDMIFTTGIDKNFMFEEGNILQTSGYHISTSQIKALDADGLKFFNQNGEGIFINDVGHVGIGGPANTIYKLIVNGNIGATQQIESPVLSSSQLKASNSNGLDITDQNGNGIFIENGGNIGIGTSIPSQKLDVNGNVKAANIFADGYIGLGTNNLDPDYILNVAGKILAEELKIQETVGADFVFNDDYNLPSLGDVELFIDKHNHLPEIPSADEMKTNGVGIGDLQIKLLQKIEELTLYIIQQQKEIEMLKSSLAESTTK